MPHRVDKAIVAWDDFKMIRVRTPGSQPSRLALAVALALLGSGALAACDEETSREPKGYTDQQGGTTGSTAVGQGTPRSPSGGTSGSGGGDSTGGGDSGSAGAGANGGGSGGAAANSGGFAGATFGSSGSGGTGSGNGGSSP